MSEVYAVINQKGGVGKTATTFNLGAGLVREGKKVLLIDFDPQCSLTKVCGLRTPEAIPIALHDVILKQLNGEPVRQGEGINTAHREGVHIIPSKKELTALEDVLREIEGGKKALRNYVDSVRSDYDVVLIDGGPKLDIMAISAMTAADKLIIPTQASYESVEGLQELLETFAFVRSEGLNPDLKIKGILFTMIEGRPKFPQEMIDLVQEGYSEHLRIFKTTIPRSIKVQQLTAKSRSIFNHSNSKAALAYGNLTKEVLGRGREHDKNNPVKALEPVIGER